MDLQSKPRLLIFDDQPVFASLLARGLSQHGYNVKVFYAPNEVLAHDQTSYEHAILGIQGQATNGLDLGLQLWQRNKDLQLCFTSIFDIDPTEVKRNAPDLKNYCLLRLPISIEEMAKHIETHHVKTKDFNIFAQA